MVSLHRLGHKIPPRPGTSATAAAACPYSPKKRRALSPHLRQRSSGVSPRTSAMINAGLYGLVRSFGLLAPPGAAPEWWGWALLLLGLGTGLMGILKASAQSNLKRLLAYSSVENMGLMTMGVGAGLIGQSCGNAWIAVLGYGGALLHMTAARVARGEAPAELGGLLAPDPLGTLFLMLASVLFLTAAFYAMHYLREEERIGEHTNILDHGRFTNTPERRFTACLCFFLASMTLVTITPHMGAQWVGIEATTLSSAQLIYFHRHKRSLEATWKYLIICSVGIALALLGNILLSVAFHSAEAGRATESLDQVGWFVRNARLAEPTWLKAAFVFLLVGYGTKMGLAPLHNWLPDAHSQAPSLVSALLSGALLNCAMLGVLRGHQIMPAVTDLTAPTPEQLPPHTLAVSQVEGWRGEICHVAVTDAEGDFLAYKVVDPSFHNWPGLALALRGNQISDFPLCNKSFNLSYCGHDL